MEISKQYLVGTEYGLNLLVLTTAGLYYQQIHSTLCHDGGGAATWVKVEQSVAEKLIENKECY